MSISEPKPKFSRAVKITSKGVDPEKVLKTFVVSKFDHKKYDPKLYTDEQYNEILKPLNVKI